MRRSGWTRSSSTSEGSARRGDLDVYLLPAVVGGGLGDVAEVLDAGRWLERAGFRTRLYRAPGRVLPPSVDGPWDWPAIEAVDELRPRSDRALTVSPTWGVSAAPARPEPYGRAGPWAEEAARIESAYGPENTLHVSLEEFARAYPSRTETRERFREGGVPSAELERRSRQARERGEELDWIRAFRTHRALGVPNVLHLMGTFEANPVFAREFPEIRQVGPLWPMSYATQERPRVGGPPAVLWYASPSSSGRLLPALARGLALLRRPIALHVRSPRPLDRPTAANVSFELLSPVPTRLWKPKFRAAALRIVTGSRTLLEALELGGPFLYFNGVLRSDGRYRRHRPEKIVSLVRLFQRLKVDHRIIADLDAFSRGFRVAEVVRRAISDREWRRGFPSPEAVRAAVPLGLGETMLRVAHEFATTDDSAPEVVARERHRAESGPGLPRSKV